MKITRAEFERTGGRACRRNPPRIRASWKYPPGILGGVDSGPAGSTGTRTAGDLRRRPSPEAAARP